MERCVRAQVNGEKAAAHAGRRFPRPRQCESVRVSDAQSCLGVAIEPLQAPDVEPLCALAREIWRAHYPPIIGEAQTEYMLAQRYDPGVVRAELEREGVRWFVARERDALAAFASYHLVAPGELRIDKLYVHPSRQRRGVGGMLISHACELALELGAQAVTLAVNKHNATAIAAYRKHGFEIRESVVKEIGGGFVMDDHIMVRDPFPAQRSDGYNGRQPVRPEPGKSEVEG